MKTASLNKVRLQEVWLERDPRMRAGVHFAFSEGNGAKSSSLVSFQLGPYHYLAAHTDSAEEILLVLAGNVDVAVGDERVSLAEHEAVLIPAREAHSVHNTGTVTAQCVGFFAGGKVESTFAEPMLPTGHQVLGTPIIAHVDRTPRNHNGRSHRI